MTTKRNGRSIDSAGAARIGSLPWIFGVLPEAISCWGAVLGRDAISSWGAILGWDTILGWDVASDWGASSGRDAISDWEESSLFLLLKNTIGDSKSNTPSAIAIW